MDYGKKLFSEQYADVAINRVRRLIHKNSNRKNYCVLVKSTLAKDGIVALIKQNHLHFYNVVTSASGYEISFSTIRKEICE